MKNLKIKKKTKLNLSQGETHINHSENKWIEVSPDF